MRDERGVPAAAQITERMTPGRRPTPQRSLGALPILLGVVAGLALCALVYFALSRTAAPASSPAPTARAICADLTAQRYDQLYTLLSPDLQAQGSEGQFAASQRELDSLLGPVRACQPSIPSGQPSGATAQLALSLQRGHSSAASASLTLEQSQGSWRISAYGQTV